VVGVGSKHGIEGASEERDVPPISPAADLLEGSLAARHDRERSQKVGGVEGGIAEAQNWIGQY
jgi:hypothetical protein